MRRLIVARPREAAAARRAVDALVRGGACAVVVFDGSELAGALQTHHCARLAAQAEKTGTALVIITNGTAQPVASFASLRLRAHDLMPLWQEGSDGGGQLLGCIASVDVAKSRAIAPGRSVRFAAALPNVAGTWPTHLALDESRSRARERRGTQPRARRVMQRRVACLVLPQFSVEVCLRTQTVAARQADRDRAR